MKTTPKQNELLTAMKAGKLDNQNQQNLIFKILNGADSELKNQIKTFFSHPDFEGFELSNEQIKKGYDWLEDQWRSPVTGNNRKSNPFGYREQNAIDNFERITLKGYYDIGTYYRSFYVPLYCVYAKDGYGFEYVVKNGTAYITG